jgi:flagellar hook-associated protein 2
MPSITFSGLATGLNTASIISQLMQVARQPETLLQAQQTSDQGKIDEFNKIESALTNLQSVVNGFKTADSFGAMQATPANANLLTATASGSAAAGTHTVKVDSLATNQRQVTTGAASSTSLIFNTGSFTIDDGVAGHTPVTINIGQGQNSLSGIASAINASSANVTASIVNDGTNYRLVVTGKDTNNYNFDFTNLATPPTGGTGALVPGWDATAYQAGAPAQLTVDGVSMTKTSNTVTDAIQGVTLNLLSQGSSTTVSVTNDKDAVTQKINSFVTAYNSAMSLINSESVYDATAKKAGVLAGNATVQSMKIQLQNMLTTIVPGSSSVRSLADLGITTDENDGTISVNSSTLSNALSNNYNDVVNLFSHNGDTQFLPEGQYGIAQQFSDMIGSMVNPYIPGYSGSGLIEIAKNSLNQDISNITDRIADMETRFLQMQTNMQNQFNALELTVSKLQNQGNLLLSYLGAGTSSSSSSSSSKG